MNGSRSTLILPCALLLLSCGDVQTTPNFVQAAGTYFLNKTASFQSTLPGVKAGDTLIATASWDPTMGNLTSITDSQGNTYIQAAQVGASVIYYASQAHAGATTLTAAFDAETTGVLYAHEYAGLAQTAPLDQTAVAMGNGMAMDSGAKTTTAAHELIFGYGAAINTASSPPPGFAIRETEGGNMSVDELVDAVGSYRVTFTQAQSGAWFALMATFRRM
jgi:hypothetical protein